MTTTQTKLDPKLRHLIDAIRTAHVKSKAPGTFLAVLENSGQYYVQVEGGLKKYAYTLDGDYVTVHQRVPNRFGLPMMKRTSAKVG